ncbi:hypothetical protein L9F63_013374, partial [Diploptera punctata]
MEVKDSDKPKTCLFCNQYEDNELQYGKFYELDGDIVTHYYCLLLSSNMEQNGDDNEGILGFLRKDILKELRRGRQLACSYCRLLGATLGCCASRCKKVFHLPCGRRAGSLHQFFGQFKSFCATHRPLQKIDANILQQSKNKPATCPICYDQVDPTAFRTTLWAPCCRVNAWFHRDCVQKLAMSAGYFFKCPLCNNKPTFQKAMLDFGIYIPEQDASWELVPNAYQELLHRHNRCDAPKCHCPKGRSHEMTGTRWELVLCKYCGSQGVHIGCGQLKWSNPEWECNECKNMLKQAQERPNLDYENEQQDEEPTASSPAPGPVSPPVPIMVIELNRKKIDTGPVVLTSEDFCIPSKNLTEGEQPAKRIRVSNPVPLNRQNILQNYLAESSETEQKIINQNLMSANNAQQQETRMYTLTQNSTNQQQQTGVKIVPQQQRTSTISTNQQQQTGVMLMPQQQQQQQTVATANATISTNNCHLCFFPSQQPLVSPTSSSTAVHGGIHSSGALPAVHGVQLCANSTPTSRSLTTSSEQCRKSIRSRLRSQGDKSGLESSHEPRSDGQYSDNRVISSNISLSDLRFKLINPNTLQMVLCDNFVIRFGMKCQTLSRSISETIQTRARSKLQS